MGFSGRDLILLFGGLFLVYKAVRQIHGKLEGTESHGMGSAKAATFGAVLAQIIILDMVFSFDSVITAVGMVDNLLIIIVAVLSSFTIMLFSAKYIFAFVNRHRDAIAAATARSPEVGDVHLSRKPVTGRITDDD
ncbi:TerC family protein [Arthrobacter sp. NPDC057388]|uniref:TerC family protein n=1 Tax=Arthrobacter sp. NPDC057388 TaxID=3346116 RepID=UPI0036406834